MTDQTPEALLAALDALLEPGHDRMKDDAIGLDCCAECAEDWPCPTVILSDAYPTLAADLALADAVRRLPDDQFWRLSHSHDGHYIVRIGTAESDDAPIGYSATGDLPAAITAALKAAKEAER